MSSHRSAAGPDGTDPRSHGSDAYPLLTAQQRQRIDAISPPPPPPPPPHPHTPPPTHIPPHAPPPRPPRPPQPAGAPPPPPPPPPSQWRWGRNFFNPATPTLTCSSPTMPSSKLSARPPTVRPSRSSPGSGRVSSWVS